MVWREGLRTWEMGKDNLNQWEAFWCRRDKAEVSQARPGGEEIGVHTHGLRGLDFGNIQASSFLF